MKTKYRVIVLEDDDAVRDVLLMVLEARGYEVHAYADPAACPILNKQLCQCQRGVACCDVLISDLEMPVANGLEVVAQALSQGCRCPHIALISGGWTEAARHRAMTLGCQTFAKPFSLYELEAWLEACESQIPPERDLVPWPLAG